MYLNGNDYQTVWGLAHAWAEKDGKESDPANLPLEVRENIFRILVAIRNKIITARTKRRLILVDDDSFMDFLYELPHYRRINRCLKDDLFDKDYLDSLHVWRPEVLGWCENHRLPIPPIWNPSELAFAQPLVDNNDNHWYENLTPRMKSIVAALHIADRLWKENESLSYSDIYSHPDMVKFNKPPIFNSLDSFREWAKRVAPVKAKQRGRRTKSV